MLSQSYDSTADALYLYLEGPDAHAATTDEIDPWTYVDLDGSGRVLGIEVLHPARDWPLHQILETYKVKDMDRRLLEAAFPRLGKGAQVPFAPPEDGRVEGSAIVLCA